MKVIELIEILKKAPENALIEIDYGNELYLDVYTEVFSTTTHSNDGYFRIGCKKASCKITETNNKLTNVENKLSEIFNIIGSGEV